MEDEPTDEESALPQAEFLWRRLRLALIDARTAAGKSQKVVAQNMGWSVSKVARIEQGAVSVNPSDVRAMFSFFGADEAVIQEHVKLAHDARAARSWRDFKDALSDEYMNYIGQEQSATQALKYETGLVPGLLQTREYSLALMGELNVPIRIAERRSEVRQLRQTTFDEDLGPELKIVVGEIVLVRRVGGDVVMKHQIERMIEMSHHDRISLFLMPFTAGAHPGLGTPFTVLEFRDQDVQSALFLEDGLKQTTVTEDPDLVRDHIALFDQLQKKAEDTGTFVDHASRILDQYYS